MKSILSLFTILLFTISLQAQTGTVRGSMIEDESGEPVLFGTVIVEETNEGTTSDLDGAYVLELTPGTYTLIFQYLGFSDTKISEVIVTAGEVTQINARLKADAEVLEEVVITAKQSRNTEAALATIKRKAVNVIDGVSSATFKRTGDGNAASAAKRVPGVSIEGGKYVYVRGLGDRYTKSILNNMDIPGLDPDRNTLQMDIFPTNVLDNIIVLKSFTADLPADFTGGIVNITTKDFPEEKTMNFSISGSYNPDMHFNSNYIDYEGGGTDILGFDDGKRDIPTGGGISFPTFVESLGSEAKRTEFNQILKSFDKTLAPMKQSSLMDYSVGFSVGDQINKGDNTIGYNLALSYKNATDYYDDVIYANYGKSADKSVFKQEQRELQTGEQGSNNVLLGGLAGIAFKTKKSKYRLNVLALQNGERSSGLFNFKGSDLGSNFEAKQFNLEYSQRRLTNILLNGEHSFKEGEWDLDWRLSPTFSSQDEPDIRFTRIRQLDNGNWAIGTESGIPERIWRYLDEVNYVGRVDLTKKIKLFDQAGKLKFGVANSYKDRAYEIQNFQILPGSTDITADPNDLFDDANLYSSENRSGVYYEGLFTPNNPNKYDASSIVSSAYVSAEFNPSANLKAIVGVRGENYIQDYEGKSQTGEKLSEELKSFDIFPSVNLIYGIGDKMNIRTSVTQTVARPSFKEASYATIIDPLSGRTFIGGFFKDVDLSSGDIIWDGDLKQTNITNIDLRWETFENRGQGISISGFYKLFKNPIEIVQFAQAPSNLQPRNVGDGQVLGAELEVKQNLDKISSSLSDVFFNLNFTYTTSKVDFSPQEYKSRVNNARNGESIKDSREMAGQAPYLINAGLAYRGLDNGLEMGLYYNVQGKTLQYVGIGDRSDVYSNPFHSLNFNASKNVGDKLSISLSVDNILDSNKESIFTSFGADDEFFSRLSPGRSIGVGLSYKIF